MSETSYRREAARRQRRMLVATVAISAGFGWMAYVHLGLGQWFCVPGEPAALCRREWMSIFGSLAAAGATVATVLFLATQASDGRRSIVFVQADRIDQAAASLRRISEYMAQRDQVPQIFMYKYLDGPIEMRRGEARRLSEEALDYELRFFSIRRDWRALVDQSIATVGPYFDERENLMFLALLMKIERSEEMFRKEHYKAFLPSGLLGAIMDDEKRPIDIRKLADLWSMIDSDRANFAAVVAQRIERLLLRSAQMRREALDI